MENKKQSIAKQSFLNAAILVLAIALFGCNEKTASDGFYSFNIAVTANKVVNPLIQIAEEKGYFKEYKFKPNYTTLEMIGTPEALVAGKLDAAYEQIIPPISYGAQGADVKIFAGTLSGGMEVVAKKADAEFLRNPANWKGKTIGVIHLSTAEMVSKAALGNNYGYKVGEDLNYRIIDGYPSISSAVAKGTLDIGLISSEYLEAARSIGLELVFHLTNLQKDYVCCRQYAFGPSFEKNKDAYKAYLKGQIRAYKDYITNPDESIRSLARLTGEDIDYIARYIYAKDSNGDRSYNPDPNYNGVLSIYEILTGWNYIESHARLDEFFNIEVYASALTEIIKEFPEDNFYRDMWKYFLENDNKFPGFDYKEI
ncbi:ABC transporter substrate-binding protein [Treponema saccharophilum]|uniref:SsuA/THI5-like domain-containing protein n=1 Tax=Treponema saccharophilum DSM 2985 TaxID=907348 RepID=H7ELR7_9SPIR|nr:ABC transporter substrate-binding protein [Treponema saccharophilum]EIC01325.1 hypothetical protein TresaDRAFT_1217 [Treponema saccharophilum DSM 2985]BDC97696.1 hypothetical protein TRSA_27950 [Treponema saccharophilum]